MIAPDELMLNNRCTDLAEDLRSVAENRGQTLAVSVIEKAVAEFSKNYFTLAVLGMVKRGKSSFCNAVLGASQIQYAPVGVTPVSNALTIFQKDSTHAGVTVEFNDGRKDSVAIAQIADYTTEQRNPQNTKGVREIVVKDAFPNLPEGIALVDTPGEGSFHAHHDDLLYHYLPSVDAAIFLITVYSPLTQEEIAFLRELQGKDVRKIFFAMNRIDQADDDEIRDAVEHNMNVLSANGISASKIHLISAKRALEGDWEGSGIGAMLSEVFAAVGSARFSEPRRRFLNRIAPVVAPLASGLTSELAAREKSAEELQAEINRLTQCGQETEAAQKQQLESLSAAWDAAERKLRSDVENALSAVQAQLQTWIGNIGVFNVVNVKREFAATFENAIRVGVGSCVTEFESTVNAAVASLSLHYNAAKIESPLGDGRVFSGGTTCGIGQFALNSTLVTLGLFILPLGIIGALFHWNVVKSARQELSARLPAAIDDIRRRWKELNLDGEKKQLIQSLADSFQLQLEPTVTALQNALAVQNSEDAGYQENLKSMAAVVEAARKNLDELTVTTEIAHE